MNRAFIFREAGRDDALCLGVLAAQVYLDTYATNGISPALAREVQRLFSTRAIEERLADAGTTTWLATCDGHLVGFAELTWSAVCPVESVRGPELSRLYVLRAFQGDGVGRRLLQWAQDQAALVEGPHLWLTAWSGNHNALAFYNRMGFEHVGDTVHLIEGVAHANHVLARRVGGAPA